MKPETEFQEFSKSQAVQKVRQALSRSVARPIWWEIAGDSPEVLDYSSACRTCSFVRRSQRNRRVCQEEFLKNLSKARQSGSAVQFLCPIQRYAVCLPVAHGTRVQGYFALCHSEQAIAPGALELGHLALGTALQEAERTQELKVLSDSIQPRCVALSTIHTIHRLISSTLNLEELLPRVARLCCQVLRAQKCWIWLVEKEKQLLVPRAGVQVGARGSSQRKVQQVPGAGRGRIFRMGEGVPGAVAKTCKARIALRRMAVPLVEEECVGVILVQREGKARPFSNLDQEILTTLAEQAVVAIRNAQMYESQERVTWGTIRSLSAILDGMDPYTPSGPSRIKVLSEVALAIAQQMRLPTPQQRSIQYAALLHDAGRVGIPEEILRKPSKLEPAEYALVKEHAIRGATLLEPLEILEPAMPIILHHHERYDGTGYPKGLKREAIPMGARILSVANAFEAMIFDRPYRKAMRIEDAAREIASHSGTQFDPKVVEAFMDLVRDKRLEKVLAHLLSRISR